MMADETPDIKRKQYSEFHCKATKSLEFLKFRETHAIIFNNNNTHNNIRKQSSSNLYKNRTTNSNHTDTNSVGLIEPGTFNPSSEIQTDQNEFMTSSEHSPYFSNSDEWPSTDGVESSTYSGIPMFSASPTSKYLAGKNGNDMDVTDTLQGMDSADHYVDLGQMQPNYPQAEPQNKRQNAKRNSTRSCTTNTLPTDVQWKRRIEKTKLCVHHLHGRCSRGSNCTFAHSIEELKKPPNLYKTRLCINHVQNGWCSKGDNCRFAHGYAQVRREEAEIEMHNYDSSVMSTGFNHKATSDECSTNNSIFENSCSPTNYGNSNLFNYPRLQQKPILFESSPSCEAKSNRLERDAMDALLKMPDEVRCKFIMSMLDTVMEGEQYESQESQRSSFDNHVSDDHTMNPHTLNPHSNNFSSHLFQFLDSNPTTSAYFHDAASGNCIPNEDGLHTYTPSTDSSEEATNSLIQQLLNNTDDESNYDWNHSKAAVFGNTHLRSIEKSAIGPNKDLIAKQETVQRRREYPWPNIHSDICQLHDNRHSEFFSVKEESQKSIESVGGSRTSASSSPTHSFGQLSQNNPNGVSSPLNEITGISEIQEKMEVNETLLRSSPSSVFLSTDGNCLRAAGLADSKSRLKSSLPDSFVQKYQDGAFNIPEEIVHASSQVLGR